MAWLLGPDCFLGESKSGFGSGSLIPRGDLLVWRAVCHGGEELIWRKILTG